MEKEKTFIVGKIPPFEYTIHYQTASEKRKFDEFMKKYEIFTLTDIVIQPRFHQAQFKIKKCTYEEIEQYLGDKDLSKYSLSKIKKDDALLKYYGFTDGYIQYTNICQDGAYVEFKEIVN